MRLSTGCPPHTCPNPDVDYWKIHPSQERLKWVGFRLLSQWSFSRLASMATTCRLQLQDVEENWTIRLLNGRKAFAAAWDVVWSMWNFYLFDLVTCRDLWGVARKEWQPDKAEVALMENVAWRQLGQVSRFSAHGIQVNEIRDVGVFPFRIVFCMWPDFLVKQLAMKLSDGRADIPIM
jgi:hypothetical protein